MNIFTDLSQSRRLKDAGFPQGKSYKIWHESTISSIGSYLYKRAGFAMGDNDYDAPSAAEIMEEMRKHPVLKVHLFLIIKDWIISGFYDFGDGVKHDLLSALVEAYCNIKKAGK
jgi:hypothetical protein